MFKVLLTAINPSSSPLEHGGISSRVPKLFAIDGDRSISISITIDADLPYERGDTKFEGEQSASIADWLSDQYGMYGHRVGDDASPIDLVAALTAATWIEWEIISGEEILDLPVPPLPPGAIS